MDTVESRPRAPPSNPTRLIVLAPASLANLHGAHQVRREAFAAVHGTRQNDVAGLQQAAHQVDEHVGAIGVVGPGRIEADVVSETARIKRPLAGGNDELGEIAGKVLGGGGRTSVAQREHASAAAVAVQQQVTGAGNGLLIQLSQQTAGLFKEITDGITGNIHSRFAFPAASARIMAARRPSPSPVSFNPPGPTWLPGKAGHCVTHWGKEGNPASARRPLGVRSGRNRALTNSQWGLRCALWGVEFHRAVGQLPGRD